MRKASEAGAHASSPRATELARAIRAARGENAQTDFAKALGRLQSVISTWESGHRTPTLEALWEVEQRLGLPAGRLAFRAGYFTAEAVEVADPEGGVGRSFVFSDRGEAFQAVCAADALGFNVRLARSADGEDEPVVWRVVVRAPAATNGTS